MKYTRAELIKLNAGLEKHNNILMDLATANADLIDGLNLQIKNYEELVKLQSAHIDELMT